MSSKASLAHQIVKKLHEQGFEALLAGGCVRDKMMGLEPKDFDIATSATPDVVQRLFPKTIPVGAQFGVILVLQDEVPFEVATFRTEGGYQDGRRPTVVNFASAREDAERRDFTVNGLYWDIRQNKVLDWVGGEADLKKKIIRTIGDPDARFGEDHLRLMRAVRFATRLGFEIEASTWKSICKNAELIRDVSAERVRDELSKTLTSPDPARGIRLLDEAGLLKHIIPEVETMKGVEQPMEFHPEGDVYVHTLLLLEGMSSPELELALAGLLHDIAKPVTFERADRIRFNGHDRIGAEMTRVIMKRLAYSNKEIDLVCELVREHLRFKDVFQMRVSTLKRFLSLDRFDLHLELHRLDCGASHNKLDAYRFCMEKWEAFKKEPPKPARLVSGDDLMALGYSPGPLYAKILRAVEDAILEGQLSTKDEAVAFIQKSFPVGSVGK